MMVFIGVAYAVVGVTALLLGFIAPDKTLGIQQAVLQLVLWASGGLNIIGGVILLGLGLAKD